MAGVGSGGRGLTCHLQGAYLGDAVGSGGGGGRVSKSVFGEECAGLCFNALIRTSWGSKPPFLAPGAQFIG